MKEKSLGITDNELLLLAIIIDKKEQISIEIPNFAIAAQEAEAQSIFEISSNDKLVSLRSIFPNRKPVTKTKNMRQLGKSISPKSLKNRIVILCLRAVTINIKIINAIRKHIKMVSAEGSTPNPLCDCKDNLYVAFWFLDNFSTVKNMEMIEIK
jgi:hypothetical protein